MDKITVKNMSSGNVTLVASDEKWRRKIAPGREIPVPQEVYDEFMFDSGIENLIRAGFLKFSGNEETIARVKDLEEEAGKVLDKDQVEKILDKKDISTFSSLIKTASEATKDSIVKLAIEKGITDKAIVALIKQYCGIDIINAIATEHNAAE